VSESGGRGERRFGRPGRAGGVDLDWAARRAALRRLDVAPGYQTEKLISGGVMLLRAEGETIET